jgi:hypothetical protein
MGEEMEMDPRWASALERLHAAGGMNGFLDAMKFALDTYKARPSISVEELLKNMMAECERLKAALAATPQGRE